jgi:hypothetical protein
MGFGFCERTAFLCVLRASVVNAFSLLKSVAVLCVLCASVVNAFSLLKRFAFLCALCGEHYFALIFPYAMEFDFPNNFISSAQSRLFLKIER